MRSLALALTLGVSSAGLAQSQAPASPLGQLPDDATQAPIGAEVSQAYVKNISDEEIAFFVQSSGQDPYWRRLAAYDGAWLDCGDPALYGHGGTLTLATQMPNGPPVVNTYPFEPAGRYTIKYGDEGYYVLEAVPPH